MLIQKEDDYVLIEREVEDDNEIIIPYIISITTCSKINPDPQTYYYTFLYLEEKYKNLCVTKVFYNYITDYTNFGIMVWLYKYKDRVDDNINFRNNLNLCIQNEKRFVIFHLYLYFSKVSAHANFIIIDKKNKTIERFEPSSIFNIDLDKRIKSYLHDVDSLDILKKFTYLYPLNANSRYSFQDIESKETKRSSDLQLPGYCAIWCMWYADLRLSNPNVNRYDIYNFALDSLEKNSYSFTDFIRSYSKFIYDISKYKDTLDVKNVVRKHSRQVYNKIIDRRKKINKYI